MEEIINKLANQSVEDESILSFAGKGLKLNTEEDAMPIIKAIETCSNLISLNLEGNTLGIGGAKAIGLALQSKPSLSKAIFKDMFTGRLKSEIPDALQFLTNGITNSGAYLEELDLSDNAFGPIGIRALIPFLQSESCSLLKILRLNNNGLGIEGGKLLGEALADLTLLKVFICGRNRLENEASTVIAHSLAKLNTLEQLEMPQNGIRVEGMEAIAKVIYSNVNLKILNLNDNTMCEEGARILAPALSKARNIEKINFGDCLLKEGCLCILKALNDNDIIVNLKELILSGNEISSRESIDLILDIFSSNSRDTKSLKLDISCNCFGPSGCDDIEKELSEKVNLIIVDDEGQSDDDYYIDEGEEEEKKESKSELPKERFFFKTTTTNFDQELETILKLTKDSHTSINTLSEIFVKVSIDGFDILTQSLSQLTLKKTDALLKALSIKKVLFEVVNSLLEQMGLIKSENGFHKISRNLSGPFLALTHSVKYFNDVQKQAFKLMLERPNANADKTGKLKYNLLQALSV